MQNALENPEAKIQISLDQDLDTVLEQLGVFSDLFEQSDKLWYINKERRSIEPASQSTISTILNEKFQFTKKNAKGIEQVLPKARSYLKSILVRHMPHLETIYKYPIMLPDRTIANETRYYACLLYTSPSPRD